MGILTRAIGYASTAMGENTEASEANATAMGLLTTASGNSSTAMGNGTTASGDRSTAIGGDTEASGNLSTAMGILTRAIGYASTAMGENTEASEANATAMGNGTTASGLISTAMGNGTTASGLISTAMGAGTEASGGGSVAMGSNTLASGNLSTALGSYSEASGLISTAMGTGTEASGNYSTTMGYYTKAPSSSEMAFGRYNTDYTVISSDSDEFWYGPDRLFTVGNGSNNNNKSNALTIYKNGNVALGNITPSSNTTENVLDVGGRMRLRPKTGSGSTSGIWYSDVGGNNTQFAGAKTHSVIAASREWGIYIDGFRFWVNGSGNATLTGSLSQNSDKRLKTNITDLEYGLKDVLQLQPKQYFWKDKPAQDQASLGLIAQDIEKIIPNIVHTGTDEKKTLSLSYIELIPVLINAIKEQQQIIDNQNKVNTNQNKMLEALLTRIETLETNASN